MIWLPQNRGQRLRRLPWWWCGQLLRRCQRCWTSRQQRVAPWSQRIFVQLWRQQTRSNQCEILQRLGCDSALTQCRNGRCDWTLDQLQNNIIWGRTGSLDHVAVWFSAIFCPVCSQDERRRKLRLWYVWETSRGRHVPDEDVVAEAIWLPQASQNHWWLF